MLRRQKNILVNFVIRLLFKRLRQVRRDLHHHRQLDPRSPPRAGIFLHRYVGVATRMGPGRDRPHAAGGDALDHAGQAIRARCGVACGKAKNFMKNNIARGYTILKTGNAEFHCASCGKNLVISNNTGGLSSEAFCVLARKRGWEVSPIARNVCKCPECQKAPRKKNDTESEIRNFKPRKGEEMAIVSNNFPVLKDPTTDQRVKIRSLLDKHFDDGVGRYLDGFSDQKIADAVDVPRIIVEKMRETGWGPIKTDPELVNLSNQLADMEAKIGDIKTKIEAMMAKSRA